MKTVGWKALMNYAQVHYWDEMMAEKKVVATVSKMVHRMVYQLVE